jgi:hypothetical protein
MWGYRVARELQAIGPLVSPPALSWAIRCRFANHLRWDAAMQLSRSDLEEERGTVLVPLQPVDFPYVDGSATSFMVLRRVTNLSGADGSLGTPDELHERTNLATRFVDQNQTSSFHPSRQVFLREYALDSEDYRQPPPFSATSHLKKQEAVNGDQNGWA